MNGLKINMNLNGEIREVSAQQIVHEGRQVLLVVVNGDALILRDRSALHEYMKYDILVGNPNVAFAT